MSSTVLDMLLEDRCVRELGWSLSQVSNSTTTEMQRALDSASRTTTTSNNVRVGVGYCDERNLETHSVRHTPLSTPLQVPSKAVSPLSTSCDVKYSHTVERDVTKTIQHIHGLRDRIKKKSSLLPSTDLTKDDRVFLETDINVDRVELANIWKQAQAHKSNFQRLLRSKTILLDAYTHITEMKHHDATWTDRDKDHIRTIKLRILELQQTLQTLSDVLSDRLQYNP